MDLREETARIMQEGYSEANAQSKLCQDIILKAIADSGMAKNATIKGGVVMRSISGSARRATQDIDIDFIKYSVSDESIKAFAGKLNCIPGLVISIDGPIVELKHQDYKGKRVILSVTDESGNRLALKMDLGVHKDLDIEQQEYSFDIGIQDDAVSLLINSYAQMTAEKLKSLLRFGTKSTRYKDVFDICYLSDIVDTDQLRQCIEKYIFDDETLSVNDMGDIVQRLDRTFSSKTFITGINRSRTNWLGIPAEEVLRKDLSFFRSL